MFCSDSLDVLGTKYNLDMLCLRVCHYFNGDCFEARNVHDYEFIFVLHNSCNCKQKYCVLGVLGRVTIASMVILVVLGRFGISLMACPLPSYC